MAARSARLSSIERAPGPGSWIRVGATQRTAGCARSHCAASWSSGQPVGVGDGPQAIELVAPRLDPAVGPEEAVVVLGEDVAGPDVVVEQPAVVDHPRDHVDARLLGRRQHVLAGPGLERVEDDHRPVDLGAEALEAGQEVEREAVGRAGGDADRVGQAAVAQGAHPLPDRFARVADAVGVVQEQQVEAVDAATLERALGRALEVLPVALGAAQVRDG